MLGSKILLGLLLLLAVGLGFGAALLLQPPPPSRSLSQAPEGVAANAPRAAPPGEIADGSQSPMSIEPQGDFRTLFRAGVQAMPREERERGQGTIHGTVRTAAGAALAGVQLQLEAVTHPEFQEADDLAGQLTRMALQSRWREAHRYVTVTDELGRYRFEDLPDQGFILNAAHKDFVIERASRAEHHQTFLRPSMELDWVAHAAVTLTFEVYDQNGLAMSHASIRQWQQDASGLRLTHRFDYGPNQSTTTVKHGTYTFWASDPARLLEEADALPVRVEVGATTPPIVQLVVPSTGSVTVHLTLGQRPIASGFYELVSMRIPPGQVAGRELFLERDHTRRRPQSSFPAVLSNLPYGSHAIALIHPSGRHIADWRTIEVQAPQQEVHWSVEWPSDTPHFDVIALAADGTPVTDLNLGYRLQQPSLTISSKLSVLSTDAGRITCCIHDEIQSGGGRITISAQHAVLGSGTAEADWPVTAPITVRLTPYASLDLHVPGFQSHRADQRFHLSLCPIADSTQGPPPQALLIERESFDAEERVQLTGLAIGDYELQWRPGNSPFSVDGGIGLGRVKVVSGPNQARIALPPFGRLVVQAEPGTELPFRLALRRADQAGPALSSDDAPREARSEKDRFTFRHIPHGDYVLSGQNSDGTPKEVQVRVSETTTITWSAGKADAIRVSISAPGGALASAGFADGDLILAVAGEAITAENVRTLLREMTYAAEPVLLRVERGGSTIDLTVNFKALRRQQRNLGGTIQPTQR